MSFDAASIPSDAVGLRLVKIVRGELVYCEAVRFPGGVPAIVATLRRAQVSGRVEVDGEASDYLADILDAEQSIIGDVSLDAKSYRALKRRWMPCRIERERAGAPR